MIMAVRINSLRLLRKVIVTLVLPVAFAMLLDRQLGWFPLVTIGASVIFIPLSTVVVIRATLAEFDRVIQQITPLDPGHKEE